MDELILAKSKAGHDKNHIYLVMKRQDDIVYLVNGKTRTCDNPKKKKDVMEKMRAYREVIHENIDYQYHAKEDVDELVELIVEVMMMPEDSMIRIAGTEKPVALVKSRFMKLNYSHIEYVLFCLNRNTTKVGNIKAYLLTALYNAPATINSYYQAEVNHDMYGG